MKRILIMVASVMLASGVAAETMRATNGEDTVRLFDTPCMRLAVLGRLTPSLQVLMRKAESIIGGREYSACWIVDGEHAHLLYEDGDQGLIRLTDFKPDEV